MHRGSSTGSDMADRTEQRQTSPQRAEQVDQNLALDQVAVARRPRHREGPELEKTSFSFTVEKETVAELERQSAPSPAAARELRHRDQPDRRPSPRPSERPEVPLHRSPPGYMPSILDKLIDLLAKLLQRLDRAVFKKFKRGRKAAAVDLEGELSALVMPPQPPLEKEEQRILLRRSRRRKSNIDRLKDRIADPLHQLYDSLWKFLRPSHRSQEEMHEDLTALVMPAIDVVHQDEDDPEKGQKEPRRQG